MNKEDLVNYIAKKAKIKKVEADRALNAAFEGITAALKKGEDASFVGFGSFSVLKRKAREGRNPRTGEKIKIAASKSARFRPGKNLRKI